MDVKTVSTNISLKSNLGLALIFFSLFTNCFDFGLAKARADQTSVRSHSSDIVDAINKDMEATGIRLQN